MLLLYANKSKVFCVFADYFNRKGLILLKYVGLF